MSKKLTPLQQHLKLFKERCEGSEISDSDLGYRLDEALIRIFTAEMESRMTEAVRAGRFGWWSDEYLTDERLIHLMDKARRDQDWVSLANYAAMRWAREGFKSDG